MRDLSQTHQTKNPSKFTTFRINLGLLFLSLAVGLVYMFSVNSMATAGFQIKQLSSQMNELEDQHKTLELQNSALQSVSGIQEQTTSLNFVPSTSIIYLKDDNFALK